MKKVSVDFYCDVCGSKTDNAEKEVPVIFLTEQTEGRKCSPYLTKENLILCDECKAFMLTNGRFVFAEGAMGSNKYFFRK